MDNILNAAVTPLYFMGNTSTLAWDNGTTYYIFQFADSNNEDVFNLYFLAKSGEAP